jgi:hypothetical protein
MKRAERNAFISSCFVALPWHALSRNARCESGCALNNRGRTSDLPRVRDAHGPRQSNCGQSYEGRDEPHPNALVRCSLAESSTGEYVNFGRFSPRPCRSADQPARASPMMAADHRLTEAARPIGKASAGIACHNRFQRAAQSMPRLRMVRISGTSNSLATCPREL